jgi:hypothetical protein
MLALILSFLPAWLVSFGANLIGAAGIGAVVYSLLPVVPYRRTIQIAGTLAICWAVYQYGIADAQAVNEAAQLRAQLAAAQRDLTAAKNAAADADSRAAILDETLQANAERLNAYETEIAKRPDNRCVLDDRDIRGVLGNKP